MVTPPPKKNITKTVIHMKKACETNSCSFPLSSFTTYSFLELKQITASWNHYFCNISSTVGRDLHMSVCTNP